MRHVFAGVLSLAVLAAGSPAPAAAPPAYAVVGRIAAPASRWDYSSVDPVRRRLYVAAGEDVIMVALPGGQVTPSFAKGARLHAVFALPDGRTVVTTNGSANTAELIDADGGAVLATIPTGTKPDAATFDPASGLVLVMNGHSGDVTLIDPAARKAMGAIQVGGALESVAVDGGGRAFVNVESQNLVAVLDIRGRRVVARYPLKGCEGPTGLAYDKADDLLVAACANGVAKAVRGADGAEVASLAIGKDPDAVILDKARSLAFIPCGGDGVLEVVALGGPGGASVVQRLPTQTGARSGAVDEATGRIYLPTARFGPPVGGDDGPMIPGSFEILVVAPR